MPSEPRLERSKSPTLLPGRERAGDAELAAAVACAAGNPVIDAVLRMHGGALVVLDEHRRILAANTAYLDLLGVDGPADVLGVDREVLAGCIYAPGGCGTSAACVSCGMMLAITEALDHRRIEERDCALTLVRGAGRLDLALHVRVTPLEGDRPLLLVTFTDVSADRRRAALERTLLHEFANMVAALSTAAEMLAPRVPEELRDVADDLKILVGRFKGELEIQRALADAHRDPHSHRLACRPVPIDQLVGSLRQAIGNHPAARAKELAVDLSSPSGVVISDRHLLERVLTCMLVNAFESTLADGEVRLRVDEDFESVTFRVWNAGAIPSSVAARIFQRYFTTKPGASRGHGTYFMKVFGERVLGGEVGFTSSAEDGTVFYLRLPRAGQGAPEKLAS